MAPRIISERPSAMPTETYHKLMTAWRMGLATERAILAAQQFERDHPELAER